MTTPTLRRSLIRAGVGVVVWGVLSGALAPVVHASDLPTARFVLANVPPMVADMSFAAPAADLPNARATVIARQTIGYSVKGRPITATLYGSPSSTRVGVMIGSMHGNELGGIPVARRLEKLGAPTGTAMWVIRNINPDGAKRGRRGNANKVDLNRNGTQDWAPTAVSREYYPGSGPASEPETRAYISFLESVKPDVVLIYHQHGNGVDSYRQKNPALTTGLGQRMKLPVKSFACLGACRGTLTGWFNTTQAGVALTVELPRRVTKAKVKRWASAARWSIDFVPDVSGS